MVHCYWRLLRSNTLESFVNFRKFRMPVRFLEGCQAVEEEKENRSNPTTKKNLGQGKKGVPEVIISQWKSLVETE